MTPEELEASQILSDEERRKYDEYVKRESRRMAEEIDRLLLERMTAPIKRRPIK